MNDPNYLLILGRIEGKLDRVASSQDRHETRISALEAFTNKIKGWAFAVGAGSGAGAATLLSWLNP